MDDLSRFCCQNSQCPDFGLRDPEISPSPADSASSGSIACSIAAPASTGSPNARVPRCTAPTCLRTSSRSSNTSTRAAVSSRRALGQGSSDTVSHYSRAPRLPTRTANWWPTRLEPATPDGCRSGRSLPRRRRTAIEDVPRGPVSRAAGTTWRSTRSRLGRGSSRGADGESVRELVTDVKERLGDLAPSDHDRRVYGL